MIHSKIRTRKWLVYVLAIVAWSAGSAQQVSPALAYMESISAEFKNVQKNTWDYTRAVAHNRSARKVENKRKELVATINTAIGKIKRLKPFEGDASYRDSCVSALTINKIVIEEDYAKIMVMEEIAEQSYDNMEAYLLAQQKADEILANSMNNSEAEERKFAASHNINLVESQDKVSKKLSQASRVYEYYNKVYLIFFKAYKQEAYMLEAALKGDVNAMEQNKNSLLKFATEGREQLKEIKSFDGDGSLKIVCQQMLDFYKEEAEKNYQPVIDFYLKKDGFEKQSAAMNSKSKSHTKEEIDEYNKAVAD
jgi:hypothetical protein